MRGCVYPPQVLTDVEVRRLLGVAGGGKTAVRNRALIGLLYRSGLRISEALSLYPVDLDSGAGTVHVRNGKGGRSRLVGMDAGGFGLVDRWLAVRSGLGFGGLEPLFCTLRGGRLSRQYVQEFLGRLAKRAGLGKRVHAHGFRHTFASQLVTEGVSVVAISKLLGHRSIVTTVRYLDHLRPEEAIRAVCRREWGGDKVGLTGKVG